MAGLLGDVKRVTVPALVLYVISCSVCKFVLSSVFFLFFFAGGHAHPYNFLPVKHDSFDNINLMSLALHSPLVTYLSD